MNLIQCAVNMDLKMKYVILIAQKKLSEQTIMKMIQAK